MSHLLFSYLILLYNISHRYQLQTQYCQMANATDTNITNYPQPLIQVRTDQHSTLPVTKNADISLIVHPQSQSIQQLTPAEALYKSYESLLQELNEIGRDIKPCYQGNRASVERLKRGITQSKARVRECLNCADRLQKMYNSEL